MASEKRLIDAADWDSFYADMGDSCNTMDTYDRGYMDALDRVDDWMDVQPTVDAVEVVRCKDCKWRQQDEVNRNFCGLGDFYCGDTDFCSRGERKDNV